MLVAGTAAPGAGTEHALTSFDLIIDPGDHVIVLSREGVADTVLNERFETGASRQLPLAMQAPAEASSPTPARPAADPEADVAVSSADATNETLMWVSYGVGAAGIAAGSVFGVLALGKKGELDDGPCNGVPKDQCQPGAGFDSLESDMNTFALASTIGFIVGGVGAAAGTYFLIAGSDGEEPAASRSSVTARAYIGPGSVKVSGTF